jgi:hypothetical protein
MIQELTSQQYFNEVVAYVKTYNSYLTISGKNAFGNCPICQSAKLDMHHLYFGVWCRYGKVYLGCHNPQCNLGTSNSILDFIQRFEGVDFHGALTIWQEFLGIESIDQEKYLTCLNQLHEGCRDAYSGNGIYRQNHIILISKRTLIKDFRWHHEELFAEIFREMVTLYFTKPHVNQKYVVQMMANHLQKLVRQEFQRAQIEISEQRLLKAHIGKGIRNDILDYVSYQTTFTDPLIERETREMHQLALNMAYESLDVIELRIIIDDKFSIRKASLITGIPKSTIAYRLNNKLKQIRQECLKTYQM